MKKTIALIILICIVFFSSADYWTQKADWPGVLHSHQIGFSIGNFGYACGGMDSYGYTFYNDLWQYDPLSNSWTQKANLPGIPRGLSMAFSINGKGYVGCGFYRICPGPCNFIYLNDLFEYNPNTNTWAQKANTPTFGGAGIILPMDSSCFVGICYDSTLNVNNQVWQYDPFADTWIPKQNLSSSISGKTLFTISNKAYVGLNQIWEYDPISNALTQKANFPGIQRSSGSGIGINNQGFFGTGTYVVGIGWWLNDWWAYNPVTNNWCSKISLPDTARAGCFIFSIANHAFLGGGSPNAQIGSTSRDLWEYTPDSLCTTGVNELRDVNSSINISPNPSGSGLYLLNTANDEIEKTEVFNNHGQRVFYKEGQINEINLGNVEAGIYFYLLRTKGGRTFKGTIIKE